MVNTSLHQFRIEEKKCLWIPRAHFPISIAIKGIGISCSTGFQQPFWKLIGFDPVSSGEEMTGGGGGSLEKLDHRLIRAESVSPRPLKLKCW